MAINRDVIGPDVLGSGELPAYGWVPPGTANYEGVEPYQPEWVEAPYEERVNTAKEIMAGLGYTAENPLKLQLKYNTNDNHQRIAVAIQSMWSADRRQGRAVQLRDRRSTTTRSAAGDYEVGRAGWLLDYSDPSNTLDLLRSRRHAGRHDELGQQLRPLLQRRVRRADGSGRRRGRPRQARRAPAARPKRSRWTNRCDPDLLVPRGQRREADRSRASWTIAKDIHRTRWLTKTE